MAACITARAARESFDYKVHLQRWSDSFLYRSTTIIWHVHRLILSSIQVSLSVTTDPSAQSCSSWPWQTRKMDLLIGRGFLVSVKSHSHFLNSPANRVTVCLCFIRFSRRPMMFSLKYSSCNFSFVGRHCSGFGDWYSRPTVCRTSAGNATVRRWSPNSF